MGRERADQLTRAKVIQLGLFALGLGGLGYGFFRVLGLDGASSGIASEALLVLIVIAWIAAAVYFKATTDKMFLRLDEMEQLQVKHVDEVNQEFRSDLKTLNLQFIGRGKHLRQAQKDIVSNNKFINLPPSPMLLTIYGSLPVSCKKS